ncbi:DNA recombination protein RmuC [Patescibacteria group bacterium]|nr:DNA recombination protein RmuC [Patescibacteria group bacterium]
MTTALIVIGLIALAAISMVVWLLSRPSAPVNSDLSVISKTLDLLMKNTQSVQVDQKIAKEVDQTLRSELRSLSDTIAQLKTRQEERQRSENEYNAAVQGSIKNIESLFRGSKSKGIAGENLLREIFKNFPPEWIVFDYRIEGKPVEFGLKLADGRIMPMDSKIVALDELARLETETDETVRQRLIKKAELEVTKKVKEVASYIHPPVTYDQAMMLIPDALYSVLIDAHQYAYSRAVILLPYSMALPYILAFRNLHSRTLANYDEQQVTGFLEDLDRILNEMETVLENQVSRGSTMITNAYSEYKKLIGKVRGRMTYLAETDKQPQLTGEKRGE